MKHVIVMVTFLALLGASFAAGRHCPIDHGHVPTAHVHCPHGCDAETNLGVAEHAIRQMSGRLCTLNQKEYCRELPVLEPMPRDGKAGQTIRCGEWYSKKHRTRGFYNCTWASIKTHNHAPAELTEAQ